MAGTYIEDLPLFSEIKETDEVIVERVEGDVRTTGRMTVGNFLGFLISEPEITAGTQDGMTVALEGSFERYAKVKIDGVLYPAEWIDDNQINVNITGLAAGEHNYVVYNAYKASNTFAITTT